MNPETIGRYFFSRNNELTDIQIQKLTYYAYAWFMIANNGAKLFDEQPQAWVHGPVFRSLYDAMKKKKFYDNEVEQNNIDINIINFLDIIYNIYSKYSGNELERLTHSESPWKKARERAGLKDFPTVRSMEYIIDKDIMEWGNN